MTEHTVSAAKAAPQQDRRRTKKVFASLAAVTMVGVAGVAGTTAALSATTENAANEFDAAFIELTDNDAGSFMYDVENQEVGDFVQRCIRISYKGSKPADLSLALSSGVLDDGAANLNLTVESGASTTATFTPATENDDVQPTNCGDFAPTGAALFDGKLDAFQATHGTQATALADPTPLAAGNATFVDYRITVELDPDAVVTSENYLSGLHTYTWYADQA